MLQIALVAFVVLYLLFGLWLAVEHGKDVRSCQDYLREHEGEDRVRDWHCWATIHEGQG